MGHTSAIEWTEATWNPWHGCHKVSQGCKNCYMFRDKARYGQDPNVVVRSKDATFYAPLKWQKPRTIFTCSWSDFFIEEADAWRDEAFAIMALTPQHTYQVLTKRPDRMLEYLTARSTQFPNSIEPRPEISYQLGKMTDVTSKKSLDFHTAAQNRLCNGGWPLPNVWLGVSVEDQKTADERIPLLLKAPAAVRWLSMEPLLGPVTISRGNIHRGFPAHITSEGRAVNPDLSINWIVAGGESGPDARPSHPDWFRSIRDQCLTHGVPFFFKQWGEYVSVSEIEGRGSHFQFADGATVRRVGKHNAGRTLDGRSWDEMPEVR